MIGIVIFIGIVLFLVILLMLFRIQNLIDIARGNNRKQVSKSNAINSVLLLLFMIVSLVWFLWYSIVNFDEYTLPIASEHGVKTDNLFWVTMTIMLIAFFITQILLFYFSYRYRHREGKAAFYYPDNSKLEIIWTIVPALVLSILVFSGLKVWNKVMSDPPEDAEVVELMGYQFAWKCRYPGKDGVLGSYDYQLINAVNLFGMDFRDRAAFDDFIPREIHIPKGKPVLLKIRARDVLHSVYAPHFRLKMDAVPGMPTSFWFTPTKSTEDMRIETEDKDFNYEIACAEVCGRGHFTMRMIVVVDEPEEYAKWKAEQEPWLTKNPDYLAQVPDGLRELAMLKTGIGD
jgi:cytochrome c oxidase subunit 2